MIIVDNKMIREPNLATPAKKPVGNVVVDWDHPIPKTYELVSAFLFRSSTDSFIGENAIVDAPWYDAAKGAKIDTGANYPISSVWRWGHDGKGEYLDGFVANIDQKLLTSSTPFEDYGWQKILEYDAYTILMSGTKVVGQPPTVCDSGSTARHLQFYATSFSTSSQTFRCINNAAWTASYDETFTQSIQVEAEHFYGVTWDGVAGYRTVHFNHEAMNQPTGYTGSLNTTGTWNFCHSAKLSPRYLFVFARPVPDEIVQEIRKDPYQILKPA